MIKKHILTGAIASLIVSLGVGITLYNIKSNANETEGQVVLKKSIKVGDRFEIYSGENQLGNTPSSILFEGTEVFLASDFISAKEDGIKYFSYDEEENYTSSTDITTDSNAKNLNLVNETLYYTANDKVKSVNLKTKESKEFDELSDYNIDMMYIVDYDKILFSSNETVYKYNITSNETTPMESCSDSIGFIPSDKGIIFIKEDNNGTYSINVDNNELINGVEKTFETNKDNLFFYEKTNPEEKTSDLDYNKISLDNLFENYSEDNIINVYDEQEKLFRKQPVTKSSQGVTNAITKARKFYLNKWQAAKTISCSRYGFTIKKGEIKQGVIYSQATHGGGWVGFDITLDDFNRISADPNSKLYTTKGDDGNPFYGTDCSTFVSYCMGHKRVTTSTLPSSGLYTHIGKVASTSIKPGDVFNKKGHVIFICGVDGKYVYTIEQTLPCTVYKEIPISQINSTFYSKGYSVYRYKHINSAPPIQPGYYGNEGNIGNNPTPPAPAPAPNPPSQGDPYLKALQAWLNGTYGKFGVNIAVDGEMGPETKTAITKAWQAEMNLRYGCGLAVNGVFDEACYNAADWNKLYLDPNVTDTFTKILQAAFVYRYGYVSNVDGIFSGHTWDNIRHFREKNNITLTPDSMPMNAETWFAIFNDGRKPWFNNELLQIQSWINATYGNNFGINVPVNGSLGYETEQAIVKAWQAEMNLRYGCGLAINGVFDEACYNAADKFKLYLVQDKYDTFTKILQMVFRYKFKYPLTCNGIYDQNVANSIGSLRQNNGIADTPPHMKMNAETWYALFNDGRKPWFNNELLQIQSWINATYGEQFGITVPVNGSLGYETEQAIVKAWQAEMNLRYGCGLEVNGYFTEECYNAADKFKLYLVQDKYDTFTKILQMAFKYRLKYDITCNGIYDQTLANAIGYTRQVAGMADTPPHMKMNAETWFTVFNYGNRPNFNNELRNLQTWINETYGAYGITVSTNGALGYDTEHAITRALQAELNKQFNCNIPITGYFDQACYEVIKNNNVKLSETEHNNLTSLLQAALRYINKYDVPITGKMNSNTMQNVNLFIMNNGIDNTDTANISANIWYSIFRAGEKAPF